MIWRISIILSLLLACKNDKSTEDFAAASVEGSLSYAQVYNYLLRNNGFVGNSAKKAASKLTFSFIHAGVQTDEYGQYIKLFFHADDDRDYIEAARCDIGKQSNTCLFGKDLDDGNILDVKEINEILNSEQDFSHLTSAALNNCWNELTDGCTTIGEAETDSEGSIVAVHKITAGDTFIDLTAPLNGVVYYIARVCINEERLDERESSNQPCSHIFRYTNTVNLSFDNERDETRKKLFQDIDRISKDLNYMTQRGHELSLAIVDGLDTCAKRNLDNMHAKNVRDSIATLAGIGVGMTASIAVFGVGDLKNMGVGADAGKALGAAFADVVRSAKDYPRKACPEADPHIAEITRLMGYKDAGSQGEEGVTDQHNHGYLYNDKVQKYEQLLMDYQKTSDAYDKWFREACFIADDQNQAVEGDGCGQ